MATTLTDTWIVVLYATHARQVALGVADPPDTATMLAAGAAAERLAAELKAQEVAA